MSVYNLKRRDLYIEAHQIPFIRENHMEMKEDKVLIVYADTET